MEEQLILESRSRRGYPWGVMKIRTGVMLLALAWGLAATAQADGDLTGRFRLLEAEHSVSFNGKTYNRRDIFRIDTATGKTWVYHDSMHGNDDNKSLTYFQGWEA